MLSIAAASSRRRIARSASAGPPRAGQLANSTRGGTMRASTALLALISCAAIVVPIAAQDEHHPFPNHATFTTLAITPLAIEGLTGDELGNLYTTGRAATPTPCPVYKIDPVGALSTIGTIPNPPAPVGCNPSGITRD